MEEYLERIGVKVRNVRKQLDISTYQLEKHGIHASMPSKIEKGAIGYSMKSLINYLCALEDLGGVKIEIDFTIKELEDNDHSNITS